MKDAIHVISFERWIAVIFDRPVSEELAGRVDRSADVYPQIDAEIGKLPPKIALQFLSTLFEQSSLLLQRYSDAQVNEGLWYLTGPWSAFGPYAWIIPRSRVSMSLRLQCVRSLRRLFEMFSARCTPHLSHLDEPGASPLNLICYMFWDVQIDNGGRETVPPAQLDRLICDTMVYGLSLPSDACRESALHGLGHWHSTHPQFVEKTIDRFVHDHPDLRPELMKYAISAKRGEVL